MASLTLGEIRTGDLESEARAEGRRHVPAVVIHADGDHVIDVAHSKRLAHLLRTPLREINGNHDWMFHDWPFFAETIRESIRDLKKQKPAQPQKQNKRPVSTGSREIVVK
jgi:pimeloyl-ACP methyl ester carboxylesterase